MAAPEYVRPVLIQDAVNSSSHVPGFAPGFTHRFGSHSAASLLAVSLDFLTVFFAGALAARFSPPAPSSDAFFAAHLAWFGLCLIFFLPPHGLYGSIMKFERPARAAHGRCRPPFYRRPAPLRHPLSPPGTRDFSLRAFVVLLADFLLSPACCFSPPSLGASQGGLQPLPRRAWRRATCSSSAPAASPMRCATTLESLRHLGFRFKGFVALTEREAESGDADIIGDVRNCLSLARSLFVDEIFFSVPAEKKLVIALVEEARAIGIDVRVVPDLYDGLAWNAPVEYIGQFPTIPLHRRDLPIGAFLLKRAHRHHRAPPWPCSCCSPIMLLLAIAIKLDSEGPVFYRAQRIGRKGRTFTCYKFRTMVRDADKLKEDLMHMQRARRHPLQDHQRPAHHPRRPHPAQVLARRAAAVLQRAARRHEPGRPASAHRHRGRAVRPRPPAPPRRSPRHDRPVAGRGAPGPLVRQLHLARHRLRRELEPLARHEDPRPHRRRGLLRHRLLSSCGCQLHVEQLRAESSCSTTTYNCNYNCLSEDALAQINPTVGDFAGNTRLILDFTARAAAQGADLVVFPELAVCGYPPADLLEKALLPRPRRAGPRRDRRRTPQPAPPSSAAPSLPADAAGGKHVRNVAALLSGGEVSFVQQKMLLPFYDVFDEQRYFEPAAQQSLTDSTASRSPSPSARTPGTTRASGRAASTPSTRSTS